MPLKTKRIAKRPVRLFRSFQYVPGGYTDKHLTVIMDFLVRNDKAYAARWAALTCADTMSVDTCKETLAYIATLPEVDNSQRVMLRVQNVADTGNLPAALLRIRWLISQATSRKLDDLITNREAYEVAAAYTAIRLGKQLNKELDNVA